jgi:riboflavin-specific deaminase-like protein
MEFRRLYPEAGSAELPAALEELMLAADAPAQRPYTIANFVSSVDGRATFQGRSGQLGDEGDRANFQALREQVDGVLVGTGTLRTERYGRLIREPERRRRREQHGLAPEPIACIVSRSGAIPTDIPLFSEPEAKIVVFTTGAIDANDLAAQVDVVRLDADELTLTASMERLRSDFGIRTVLCEGGPTLFGGLLSEGLVDELFLTFASKLVGGGQGPPISSGPELSQLQQLRLLWALERGGTLYLRYRVCSSDER